MGVDPFLVFQAKGRRVRVSHANAPGFEKETNPFQELATLLRRYRVAGREGRPPFWGGAIGYVGYEAKNIIEPRLPQKAVDDLDLPDFFSCFLTKALSLIIAIKR